MRIAFSAHYKYSCLSMPQLATPGTCRDFQSDKVIPQARTVHRQVVPPQLFRIMVQGLCPFRRVGHGLYIIPSTTLQQIKEPVL